MKSTEEVKVYQLTMTAEEVAVLCEVYGIMSALLVPDIPEPMKLVCIAVCLKRIKDADTARESLSGKMTALLTSLYPNGL